MAYFSLQNFVFPSLDHSAPDEMYARCKNPHATVLRSNGSICFERSGLVYFDTFFNGISVKKWKKNCEIDDLYVSFSGEGEFVVRLGVHRVGHEKKWLSEHLVHLVKGEIERIAVNDWDTLEDGIIFVSIKALKDGVLFAADWNTTTEYKNEVKLGIVVTHFNREEYAVPAIKRINEKILSDDEFRGKIELVVVDNSKSLDKSEVDFSSVTLIPNENYGGSGGFTRGLIYLQDNGFTHCLFMDDDASCEVESIKRAFRLLCYVCDKRCAVSGSMLLDVEPSILFEKGAIFDGTCRPLKSGLDMKKVDDLLEAEIEDAKPDYGGWWFFAFSLDVVESLAFPFFVRGDDLMFSMVNNFEIVTMNGIATWGDDFSLKSSPLTWYLDTRNHLVQKITHMNGGRISILKVACKYFIANVFSYNYSSARAVTKAVRDVAKGPTFWKENIDTCSLRKEVGSYLPSEKMVNIDRSLYSVKYKNPEEGRLRKIFRFFTLNGYLAPSFIMSDDFVFQHKSFKANFREIFLHKKIIYEYEPYGLGYVAEHSKKLFFKECLNFFKAVSIFFVRYKKIRKNYDGAISDMTSRRFWVDVLKLNKE